MMIEKIARALVNAKGANSVTRSDLHQARAVLTAMLEPTEAMAGAATMFDIANGRGGWVNMSESEFYELNGHLIRAALDE